MFIRLRMEVEFWQMHLDLDTDALLLPNLFSILTVTFFFNEI